MLATAGALTAVASMPAHASEKDQQIGLSSLVHERGGSVAVTYSQALDSDLAESGPRLRIGAGYGASDSDKGPANKRTSAELLVGYQIASEGWRLRAHAGVTYVDRRLLVAGRRDGLGVKVTLDAQTSRAKDYYIDLSSSYGSLDNSYRFAMQTGVRAGTVFIGPEAAILGSDYFTSKRVGAVVTGIKLNRLRLSVRTGYSFGDEEGGHRDTPYGGIGLSMQF